VEIRLAYEAREQFVGYHKRKERWACLVAHRRAGKTVACVFDLVDAALDSKKQNARYAYIAPLYAQAKDVVWSYLKDAVAPLLEYGAVINESELRVDLPNGARVRLYGADNYNRMRGVYFDGVVLDEFADMDPRAWTEVVRPALSDRQGWCTFIGTPKGENKFFEIWEAAQDDDEWFTLMLRASDTGILPDEELAAAKKVQTKALFNQEYECSFQAAIVGAYYGDDMERADKEGRICSVPVDDAFKVHTAWDLGIGDSTAITFFQYAGREVRIIDYYEASGVGLAHYANILQEKGYFYGEHFLPHDAQARELGTGLTRVEVLASLGVETQVIQNHRVEDGINAVRYHFEPLLV